MKDIKISISKRQILLFVCVILIALNLNTAVAFISPIISDIAAGYGISVAACGQLCTVTLFAFAIGAPLSALLADIIDVDNTVTIGLFTLFIGQFLRIFSNYQIAFLGFCLTGFGVITLLMMVQSIFVRDFSDSLAMSNSIYSIFLNGAAAVSTLIAVPLLGFGGWKSNFILWLIITGIALVVWVFCSRLLKTKFPYEGKVGAPRVENVSAAGSEVANSDEIGEQVKEVKKDAKSFFAVFASVVKKGSTWMIVLYFSILALSFFTITVWLPTILGTTIHADLATAGSIASIFPFACIPGGLLVPLVLKIKWREIGTGILFALCFAALPLGCLAFPSLSVLWVILGGIGQGGTFVLIFVLAGKNVSNAREMSFQTLLMNTIAYLIAAIGPTLIGDIGTSSPSGWYVSLGILTSILFAEVLVSVGAVTLVSRGKKKSVVEGK